MAKSVSEYVAEYEFRGDGGDYTPNEGESVLIEDAILGYLSEIEVGGRPDMQEIADAGLWAELPDVVADGSTSPISAFEAGKQAATTAILTALKES